MQLFEQLLMIVTFFLVLGSLLWVLRKKGLVRFAVPAMGPARQRRLEVIERLVLTPQHSLHLVRVPGRCILVGLSPSGCNVLDTIELDAGLSLPDLRAVEK